MACIFGIVMLSPFMIGVILELYEIIDLIISKIIYAPKFKDTDTLLFKILRKVFPEDHSLLNTDSDEINFDEEEEHQNFMDNIKREKNHEK